MLSARTTAKQISKKVEVATAPFQYALKTKAVCECGAHVVQTLTDKDSEATVMSRDGGRGTRSDLPQRDAWGPAADGGRRPDLPLREMLQRQPIHSSVGRRGGSLRAFQGERGEQGDPFMPKLFAVGQHGALEATQARLGAGEDVFAHLDDIYTVSGNARVGGAHVVR